MQTAGLYFPDLISCVFSQPPKPIMLRMNANILSASERLEFFFYKPDASVGDFCRGTSPAQDRSRRNADDA